MSAIIVTDPDELPDDEVVDVQAIVAENRNDDMAAWLGVKRRDSR